MIPLQNLNSLAEAALTRLLDEDEIAQLCELCVRERRKDEIILKLLLGGTAFARHNVLQMRSRVLTRAPNTTARIAKKAHKSMGADREVHGVLFHLTTHALERAASRFPELTEEDFLREARSARHCKGKTVMGQERWVSPLGIIFVLKRDPFYRLGLVCVTILPWRERVKTDWVG